MKFGVNEHISCMCSVGVGSVYWEYENSSVWLICLCCVCLEEPGRLLSWEINCSANRAEKPGPRGKCATAGMHTFGITGINSIH